MGRQFHTLTWVAGHLPQKLAGSLAWLNIAVTSSSIVLFARSALPFCWGLFLVVWSLKIPESSQNLLNSEDMYSPPLSSLRTLIFRPVWFSAYAWNCLKAEKVSDLALRGITTRNRE